MQCHLCTESYCVLGNTVFSWCNATCILYNDTWTWCITLSIWCNINSGKLWHVLASSIKFYFSLADAMSTWKVLDCSRWWCHMRFLVTLFSINREAYWPSTFTTVGHCTATEPITTLYSWQVSCILYDCTLVWNKGLNWNWNLFLLYTPTT